MKGKATERSLAFRRTSKRRKRENEQNTKVRKMMRFRAERKKTAQRFNGGSPSSTYLIGHSQIRRRKGIVSWARELSAVRRLRSSAFYLRGMARVKKKKEKKKKRKDACRKNNAMNRKVVGKSSKNTDRTRKIRFANCL